MAAFHYDDFESDPSGRLATLLNWGGAALSILLIAGLATWGWKLWQRDVTGIPVVRALEGPMRVAPEEPGGLASEYQGLTVNRIAEDRTDETQAERVVLAPAPATLNEEEDLPMAALPSVAPEQAPGAEDGMEFVEIAPAPQIGEPESYSEVTLADEDGPVEEDMGVVLTEEEPTATDLAVAAALADIGIAPEPAIIQVGAASGVPSITPRPAVRPANLQRVSLDAPRIVDGEVDASTIPAGTRLVQLGAYASPEVARAEWANAESSFGDYLVGRSRVVQEVQTGGRTFYRLRAMGFDDLADARRFCAVLVADGANCIPVLHD
jgi:hypothetical protein